MGFDDACNASGYLWAILSTTLAIIQIGNFIRSQRYLDASLARYYDENSENIEIKISNRSTGKTEIHNIMIGVCELSNTGHIELLSARGFDARKSTHIWEREEADLNLPFSLNPGESIYINFGSDDAASIISPPSLGDRHRGRVANAFELEIEHSQGREFRLYFEMDREDLKGSEALVEIDSMSLMRSRIWRFHRSDR